MIAVILSYLTSLKFWVGGLVFTAIGRPTLGIAWRAVKALALKLYEYVESKL